MAELGGTESSCFHLEAQCARVFSQSGRACGCATSFVPFMMDCVSLGFGVSWRRQMRVGVIFGVIYVYGVECLQTSG